MDTSGGTNYVLVGTTQLLSVPYALTSRKLALQAGEGIVLTSPNGTPYNLNVNDNGELSLQSSANNSNLPNQLYLYGSFNNFETSTSLMMNFDGYTFSGYKYLTAGTQIKFLSNNTSNAQSYGVAVGNLLNPNANAYTIPSDGFYFVLVDVSFGSLGFRIESIGPKISGYGNGLSYDQSLSYDVNTNTFFTNLNNIDNSYNFSFIIPNPNGNTFGDNLMDGTIERNGSPFSFANATSTPKNYSISLVLNFNGSGNYVYTIIP